MARHKIQCFLSEKSFKDAANEVRKYRVDFDNKCKKLIHELTIHGYNVVGMTVSSIAPIYKGEDIQVTVSENSVGQNYFGKISLSGSQAIFIEFGAGVIYNTSAGGSLHPQGQNLGMTIGSYNPSSPNATSKDGWYYKDKWDAWQHTYGTPTYMPLQKGLDAITSDVKHIARSVFG